MTGREGPANERIVTLLQQILCEVKDIKVRQQLLETEPEKTAETSR